MISHARYRLASTAPASASQLRPDGMRMNTCNTVHGIVVENTFDSRLVLINVPTSINGIPRNSHTLRICNVYNVGGTVTRRRATHTPELLRVQQVSPRPQNLQTKGTSSLMSTFASTAALLRPKIRAGQHSPLTLAPRGVVQNAGIRATRDHPLRSMGRVAATRGHVRGVPACGGALRSLAATMIVADPTNTTHRFLVAQITYCPSVNDGVNCGGTENGRCHLADARTRYTLCNGHFDTKSTRWVR